MSTAAESTETTAQTGLSTFRPRITHVAYYVSDIDRALEFYVGVLGLVEQMRIPLPGDEQEVVLGFPEGRGGGLILMWSNKRDAAYALGDGYSRFVMTVSDVDGAVAHLAAHGTRIVSPPADAGPMRYAMVADPDGYTIELLQLKRG
jgi:catechol 2,3-dioxygenase-like lactoylglutathione lyase family enzyme